MYGLDHVYFDDAYHIQKVRMCMEYKQGSQLHSGKKTNSITFERLHLQCSRWAVKATQNCTIICLTAQVCVNMQIMQITCQVYYE